MKKIWVYEKSTKTLVVLKWLHNNQSLEQSKGVMHGAFVDLPFPS